MERYPLKGFAHAKRQMKMAAVGRESVLLFGPRGSGLTAMAKWLHFILPDMEDGSRPPFRAPHCSVSAYGLFGDREYPGEVELARGGVLFLDEVEHFDTTLIEEVSRKLEKMPYTIAVGSCSLPDFARANPLLYESNEWIGRARLRNITNLLFDLVIDLEGAENDFKGVGGLTECFDAREEVEAAIKRLPPNYAPFLNGCTPSRVRSFWALGMSEREALAEASATENESIDILKRKGII